ncbi:hypothetical protein E4656_12780 [Natronospirillum operosum]|uniref:Tetratricopeptide repeat protein n=1 Tax=Natronospirillum operosum TaxID=2759953 RepID=A0A4Z0W4B9_9GAMM|nr:tetratricopeptide repeat protein [Natronospirillum operosum]TGG92347.1 hypothetical protein E4656_12780 [Natronospirillum operosum]
MSNLVSSALRRRENAIPPPTGEPKEAPWDHADDWSEPRFNPLAGARSERQWPGMRITMRAGYAVLAVIILWQGWQVMGHLNSPEPATFSTRTLPEEPTLADSEDAQPEPATDAAEPAVATAAPDTPADIPIASVDSSRAAGSDLLPADTTADLPTLTPPVADAAAEESAVEGDAPTAAPTVQPSSIQPATADTQGAPAETAAFSATARREALEAASQQFASGDEESALQYIQEWLRQDDHTEVRQFYARLLLRHGDAETARYAVRPGFNRPELELRAYADYKVGAYADARRHYEELLRRADNPQQEWYLWLAICHDHLQDTAQAIRYFEAYLNQAEGQPASLVRHARERLEQLSG